MPARRPPARAPRVLAVIALGAAALAAVPALTEGGVTAASTTIRATTPLQPPTAAPAGAQAPVSSTTASAPVRAASATGGDLKQRGATTRLIPHDVHGRAAIAALGAKLPQVAARTGWTTAKLRSVLASDESAHVSQQGHVYYQEDSPAPSTAQTTSTQPLYPTSQTFLLHSRPGATRKIFLDFDGATVSGTGWNTSQGGSIPDGAYTGFDLDGDPSTFSTAEHAYVQQVWRQVSEIYSPFDVDVTTQDPGVAGLTRSSSSDSTYGTHVVITSSNAPRAAVCGTCLGIAYVGTFGDVDSTGYYQPAWVFDYDNSFDPMVIAQAAAHETGHTLGLSHDGTATSGYYSGTTAWGPIMGSSMNRAVSQFSQGEYAGANNHEDDFAVMQSNGLPLRPDDYPGVDALGAQSSYAVSGVIGTRTDTDSFAIDLPCVTDLQVAAKGIGANTTLDLSLTVLDSTGAVVASNSPASTYSGSPPVSQGMDAAVSIPAATGAYTLVVDGVGNGDPAGTGWSDYGSLGQYTVTATGCAASTPTVSPTVSPSPSTSVSTSASPRSSPSDSPSADPTGAPTPSDSPSGTPTDSPSASPTGAPSDPPPTAPPASRPTAAPVHAPSAPRIGTALSGRRDRVVTATARWYPPAATGGSAVTSYRILALRVDSSGRVLRSYVTGAVSSTLRSASLRLPRGHYRFRVQALNRAGASAWSPASGVVTAR